MGASFLLLLLTCVEPPIVQRLAAIGWLLSLLALASTNLGAALGLYIASVAYHGSVGRSLSLSGLLEHPDNLALAVIFVAMGIAVVRRSTGWHDRRVLLLIALFMAFGLMNIFVMVRPSSHIVFTYVRTFIIPFIMFVLAFRSSMRPDELRVFLWTLIVLGIHTGILAIFQQLGWKDLIFPRWITDPEVNGWYYSDRSSSLLMQPAWSGLLLNFALVVVLYGKRLGALRIPAGFQSLLSVLFLVGVFFTYTRAVWLGTLLILFAFFWIGDSATSRTPRATGLRRLLLVAAVFVGLSTALLVPSRTASERTGNVSTIKYRLDLWNTSLNMALARPVMGHGYGTFSDKAAEYHEETFGVVTQERLIYGETSSHNTLLQVLVELGAVGLALYMSTIWFIYRLTRRRVESIWGGRGKWVVAVILGTYLLQIQFGVASDQTTNIMVFTLVGAIAGVRLWRRSEHELRPGRRAHPGLSARP